MSVYRVYVEKKAPFAVEAQGVLSDIRSSLGIHSASCVRILNRYDVEDISKEDFELAKGTIFSEPQVDDVMMSFLPLLQRTGCLLSSFCRVSSTSAQTLRSSASSWQPSMSVRPLLLQRSM